jgi:argininosuccinate lyase
MGKALFLGYNRETQWSTYLIMDLVDECLSSPALMGEIILTLKVNRKEMAARAQKGFIAAPELVEQIVQEWKIPFRQAKGAVERAIRYAEREGAEALSLPAMQRALQEEGIKIKPGEAFIRRAQEARDFLAKRAAEGGPSPRSLDRSISRLNQTLRKSRSWLHRKVRQQSAAKANLARMERTT